MHVLAVLEALEHPPPEAFVAALRRRCAEGWGGGGAVGGVGEPTGPEQRSSVRLLLTLLRGCRKHLSRQRRFRGYRKLRKQEVRLELRGVKDRSTGDSNHDRRRAPKP